MRTLGFGRLIEIRVSGDSEVDQEKQQSSQLNDFFPNC